MSYPVLLAQGTTEPAHQLPMSAAAFGLLAIIVFVSLLGLTWTFRNTSNKRH
jgi:hypothetical protein